MTCRYCPSPTDGASPFCAPCAERWAFVQGIKARLSLPVRTPSERKGVRERPIACAADFGSIDEIDLVIDGSVLVGCADYGKSYQHDELPDIEFSWEVVP